jgi:pSer/pThr/pTyr-binding forkhead associated (FHA) protein
VGRTRTSKLHIKDPAVSERHAVLRWEQGRWTVTDTGSSNGTAVNGRKLQEGAQLPACF